MVNYLARRVVNFWQIIFKKLQSRCIHDTHILVMEVEVCYEEHLVCTNDVCCICTGSQSNTKLDCGHDVFCMECIHKWFQRKTSCPLCRAQISQVYTHDKSHKEWSLEEEVMFEVAELVKQYAGEKDHKRYMKTIYPIVKKYPAGKLLQLFNMHKGQIELEIQKNSFTRLLENYYKYKKTIHFWITSLP